MSIKDNAKSQFKDKLAAGLKSIDVPEWDGKIYYKPAINGKQQAKILKYYDQGKTIESVCMAFIVRALDENGDQIWREGELVELMREYDTDVISRIVTEISDDDPTVDEAKKP